MGRTGSETVVNNHILRPWLSGIMGPCQGSVGSSILPGRTTIEKARLLVWFFLSCGRIERRNEVSQGRERHGFKERSDYENSRLLTDSPWPHKTNKNCASERSFCLKSRNPLLFPPPQSLSSHLDRQLQNVLCRWGRRIAVQH